MNRPHIAFFGFPYAASVSPTLAVLAELARSGFRVSYLTSRQYARSTQSTGAEFIECPAYIPDSASRVTENIFVDMGRRTLKQVLPFYQGNRPDLIVYDWICCAGRIIANQLGVRAIQTTPAFAFDSVQASPRLQSSIYGQEVLATSASVNQFLEAHGCAGDFPFHREDLNICFFPERLKLDAASLATHSFYAGRCAVERPIEHPWAPAHECNRPVLLVTTSTVYVHGQEFFEMCADALSGLPWHLVLAIGDGSDPQSFMPLPAHVEIVQHVPQIQVLPHADLVIGVGGMMVTLESLYHGVPMLRTTRGSAEAELYADHFMGLGLGPHLRDKDTNPETLRQAVCQLAADTSHHKRILGWRDYVRSLPGARDAAARIVDHLRSV